MQAMLRPSMPLRHYLFRPLMPEVALAWVTPQIQVTMVV